MPNPSPKRSLTPLILIALTCLAPVVLAALAYFVPSLGLRPESTSNYGTLVEQRPVLDSAPASFTTLEGEAFDMASLQGKWVLLSVDSGACNEECVRKLFTLRNSHASQGKNVDRLTRVWLITDDVTPTEQIQEAYVGTHMLRTDTQSAAALLAPSLPAEQQPRYLQGGMWIIDPLGNLMMEFPPDADPLKVRKDISKLLYHSRVG